METTDDLSDDLFTTGVNMPNPVLSISDSKPTSYIIMNTGADEMLKVAPDGFYVRGVKVPQDEREAETVYNAFLQWMSYMALTRNY